MFHHRHDDLCQLLMADTYIMEHNNKPTAVLYFINVLLASHNE